MKRSVRTALISAAALALVAAIVPASASLAGAVAAPRRSRSTAPVSGVELLHCVHRWQGSQLRQPQVAGEVVDAGRDSRLRGRVGRPGCLLRWPAHDTAHDHHRRHRPTTTTDHDRRRGPAARIMGYFAEWGVYGRNYHVKNIDTSGSAAKLTHIIYAFGNVHGGHCSIGDSYADYEKAYTAAESASTASPTPGTSRCAATSTSCASSRRCTRT